MNDSFLHENLKDNITYSGYGVGGGIAIGTAYVYDTNLLAVDRYDIASEDIKKELDRFLVAAKKTRRQIAYLQKRARNFPGAAREELGFLFDAYDQMLKSSRFMRGIETRIKEELINAEAAVQEEIAVMVEAFASIDDPYLAARIEDVSGVGKRLVRNLSIKKRPLFSSLPKNTIILANELTPADTLFLDPKKIAGFATVSGGAQSHIGILARSLGLPAVIGTEGLIQKAKTGDMVIINGNSGKIIIQPSEETISEHRILKTNYLNLTRSLKRLSKVPAITTDGTLVKLKANIELPSETQALIESGADGVGLLRTEFMFMNRKNAPNEEEQFNALKSLVIRMEGRPVTIRTLDIGNDKMVNDSLIGIGKSPNPALGLRGIRYWLQHEELIENQMSAILRVSVFGQVKILLPMISTTEELQKVRKIRDDIARSLRKRNIAVSDPLPPIGVMIEVPSAALVADNMAWHADFFSIGTNDLTQYTLAIDRTDNTVMRLYNPLHPSVLKLMQLSTEAAFKARIPVGVCGEMAADPRMTALLVGLGVRELSMPASSIPWVKKRLRQISLRDSVVLARNVMNQCDSKKIYQIIDDFEKASTTKF
ncbi:MAG: phosphoenolpyruvate--protein phosphotransferase [Alphaproteobacteria bacterium]|nr:phosphoenolpyruvate--protein phosphotransferase [Alphaproteobacteria bacterium]